MQVAVKLYISLAHTPFTLVTRHLQHCHGNGALLTGMWREGGGRTVQSRTGHGFSCGEETVSSYCYLRFRLTMHYHKTQVAQFRDIIHRISMSIKISLLGRVSVTDGALT